MLAPNESHFRAQAARATLRLRAVAFFLGLIVILAAVSFYNRSGRRIYYGILSGVAALALVVQYRRERALVGNRLLAFGVVTDLSKPLRSRTRFIDSILSRFTGNIPLIKYSFVAFDQKTYTGQTGWGAAGLMKRFADTDTLQPTESRPKSSAARLSIPFDRPAHT
jgi:hypothetical protein